MKRKAGKYLSLIKLMLIIMWGGRKIYSKYLEKISCYGLFLFMGGDLREAVLFFPRQVVAI